MLPTARLVPWPAVLGPLAGVSLLVVALRAGDLETPSVLGLIALTALAAAVALSLDDPAHELTAALPVGRRRRAVHRLGLVVPVVVGGWALASSTLLPDVARRDSVSLLVSMASVAVAVAVVAERARPAAGATFGAATPFAVVAADLLAVRGPERSLLDVWADHPWPVVALAATVTAIGLRR